MENLAKSIIEKALKLPSLERAVIADQLLLSLDCPDSQLDEIWAKEAEARIDALERGEVSKVSSGQVFGKYKS